MRRAARPRLKYNRFPQKIRKKNLHECGDNTQNSEAASKQEPSTPVSAHQAHWSYEGDTSPEHWAKLDKLFTTCSTGKSQPPINIQQEKVKDEASLSPVTVEYSPSPGNRVG
nr:carbonic anhydrase family protein [Paenibacillus helianthi]